MRRLVLLVSGCLTASTLLTPTASGSPARPAAPVGLGRLQAVDAGASDDAWAVGFSTIHGHSHALTEHWDGTRWSVVANPSPSGAQLGGVTMVGPDDVWAVGGSRGHTLAMHWDGSAWTVVRTPSPRLSPFLEAVAAVGPDDVWAVGVRRVDEEVGTLTLVEHWDGSRWSVVTSPNPDETGENRLDALTVVGADDVLAVGSSDDSQLAERWEGSRWRVEQTAPAGPDSELVGVVAIAADDTWAVGDGFRGSTLKALTQHWDGATWSTVASHAPAHVNSALIGVDGDATDDVWAVGFAHPVGGKDHTLAMHWNGTGWTRAPTPSPARFSGSDLGSVSVVSPVDAWAVGIYSLGRFRFKPLIEHWDGASWTKVRPG